MIASENIVVERIRDCFASCLASSEHGKLDQVSDALRLVLGKLDSPMQLAIIGKVSSTKSTLVNAILGKAEVVGTGQMEKTYNVCWLKYGSSDDDVKAVLKDGSIKKIVRKDWERQANPCEGFSVDNVKYYEVTYEHEILKSINIIDTPGLDSVKGTDSDNTLGFLRDVRPDAVIMLFTRALAESTLSVVKNFQGRVDNSFSLTPLNAVGLLSKIDYSWSIDDSVCPKSKAFEEVIKGSVYKLFPEVRNVFFEILPICSMLGLASKTVDEDDMSAFIQLSRLTDSSLHGMLSTPDDFLEGCTPDVLTADERVRLYRKFGLYGIWEAVNFVRNTASSSLNMDLISGHLRDVSGFGDFEDCLYSHFGSRSFLVKTQNAGAIINSACERQREQIKDVFQLKILDDIQAAVLSCLMGVFDYKQLDFLKRVYEEKMNVKNMNALNEFKRVCGEYGVSAVDRLGLTGTPSAAEMMSTADEQSRKWNMEHLCSYHLSGGDSELYEMLSSSYSMLYKDIKDISEKVAEAEKVILKANEFLYGK